MRWTVPLSGSLKGVSGSGSQQYNEMGLHWPSKNGSPTILNQFLTTPNGWYHMNKNTSLKRYLDIHPHFKDIEIISLYFPEVLFCYLINNGDGDNSIMISDLKKFFCTHHLAAVQKDTGSTFMNVLHFVVLNSSSLCDALIHQWMRSSLVEVMVCHLCGAKPLVEPVLANCQLDPWQHTLVKF